MRRNLLLALILLLPACRDERITVADFYAIAPQVLEFAERDARTEQPGRVADGPLYVNVNSFRFAGHELTGAELHLDSVSAVLGDPVLAVQEQALLCDTTSGFGGCWVRRYGVWVNWNLARGNAEEVRATVRSSSTDRRTHPTDFCDRVWRLTFRKQAGRWAMAERDLMRDCRTVEAD